MSFAKNGLVKSLSALVVHISALVIAQPRFEVMWRETELTDSVTFAVYIWECIQKFLDWLLGARTAKGTILPLGAVVSLSVSQSSEFFRYNPLCCFSTSVYFCKRIFHYRLNPATFGHTLAYSPPTKTFCQRSHALDNHWLFSDCKKLETWGFNGGGYLNRGFLGCDVV
jgi:hypothetical protein